jgi:thiol-disulfide isomerase/thioredoxin
MKKIILFVLFVLVLFVFGCTNNSSVADNSVETVDTSSQDTGPLDTSWQDIDLADIKTGETFRISDFAGKPILLESFAVWCPTCTKQQREIKKLHEEVGDTIVSISIDTDINEDADTVLDHINQNGFDWRYTISPISLTQSLIEIFGVGVVNAPSAPVVLICEDQSYRLLPRGTKSSQELKVEIAKGC